MSHVESALLSSLRTSTLIAQERERAGMVGTVILRTNTALEVLAALTAADGDADRIEHLEQRCADLEKAVAKKWIETGSGDQRHEWAAGGIDDAVIEIRKLVKP